MSKPHVNGGRGWMLIAGGLYAMSRGVAYLPPIIPTRTELPKSLDMIDAFIPLPAWGAAWFLIGLFCVIFSFKKDDGLAWSSLCSIGLMWGVSFLISSFVSFSVGDVISREWIPAGSYLWPAGCAAYISWKAPNKIGKK